MNTESRTYAEQLAALDGVFNRRWRRQQRRPRSPLGGLLWELRLLADRRIHSATLYDRAVGAKTRRERRCVMKGMLVKLYRSGLKLRHLKNFQSKHALAILRIWTERGYRPATMATYVSHLRTFCLWLEKPHLLEVIDRYCSERPELTRRHTATDRDKSERGAGIPFAEILRRALALDERFACQLALIAAFGLRSREAWLFRPRLAAGELNTVTIAWGTKGGRPRTLPVPMTPERRAVLEWAKTFPKTPAESMIPRDSSPKEWSHRYYHLCRRIGLTRRDLAITPHALRHGVLLDLYEAVTGRSAPARGTSDAPGDAFADRAARELVAEFAGHSRPSVSSAYLGPVRRRSAPGSSADSGSPEPPRLAGGEPVALPDAPHDSPASVPDAGD